MRLGHPEPYGPASAAAGYPTRGPQRAGKSMRSAMQSASWPQRHGAHTLFTELLDRSESCHRCAPELTAHGERLSLGAGNSRSGVS